MSAAHMNPPIKVAAKKKAVKKKPAPPNNQGLDDIIKKAVEDAVRNTYGMIGNPAGNAYNKLNQATKGAASKISDPVEKGVQAGITAGLTGVFKGIGDSFKGPGKRIALGLTGVVLLLFALVRFTAPVTVPVAETVGAGAVAGRVARGAARVAK